VKPPAWLAELHRQWYGARGLSLQASTRPFSRDWQGLLDAAGLSSAAERSNAETEAKQLQDEKHLELRTHKYRTYLIEKVVVPIAEERWLIELFGGTPALDLRRNAAEIVASARSQKHPRWPESWEQLCDRLLAAFADGKNVAPFYWKNPQETELVLNVLYKLTEKEWPAGTLVRNASEALTGDSKFLEDRLNPIESALSLLFGEETTLDALGILNSQSHVFLQGSLILHFGDGTVQSIESPLGDISLSLDVLCRAERATTLASRILTIENVKTTLRQAVAANANGDTLLIATSYPNAATKRLLEILPADLPHYHFGDTDASGYAILRSLREIGRRPVERFLMAWQDSENSAPLSEHDRRLLPSLKTSFLMNDCLADLLAMQNAGRKGRFEQEAYGAPALAHWPFWTQFS
jgi:hypothetical protein